MRRQCPTVAVLAITSFAHAGGDIILSNHPGNDAAASTIDAQAFDYSKAMGFTMPDGPLYIHVEATLRLQIPDLAAVPRVEIFDDAGGAPGVSLATLRNPSIDTVGIGDFTFEPEDAIWLEPTQSYWLVVSASEGIFNWMASDPPQEPWGWGEHLDAAWGAYPPSEPSSTLNTYYLEAWYPAPGALASLAVGGLALYRRR